ncbi:hypothetical protein [Noviherbaspirillum aridicola]|uniref:hypothetical protein n=1 Tax=Noviherbaspirillum aridicola TaxID=2849687 RepID=UPI001C811F0F|nr:hypothetical protein [Noviherbaspirillum aridicola]
MRRADSSEKTGFPGKLGRIRKFFTPALNVGGKLPMPRVHAARQAPEPAHEKQALTVSGLNGYKEAFWKEVDQHAKVPPDKRHMARGIVELATDLIEKMRFDKNSVSAQELELFAGQVTKYFDIDWQKSTGKAASKYPWVNIPSNLIGLAATYAAAASPPSRALALMSTYVALAFIPLFVAHTFVFQAQFRSMEKTAKVTSDSVKTMPLPEVAKALPRAVKALEAAISNLTRLQEAPQGESGEAMDKALAALQKAVTEVRNLVGEAVTIDAKYMVEKEATRYTTVVRRARAVGSIGAALTGIMLRDPMMGAHVLAAVVAGQIIGQVYASYPDTWRKQKAQAELSLRAFDPFKEAGLELPEPGKATDEQVQKFMYTLGRKMFGGQMEQRVGLVEKVLAEAMRKEQQTVGRMMNKDKPSNYIRLSTLRGKVGRDAAETAELAGLEAELAAVRQGDNAAVIGQLIARADAIAHDISLLRDRSADWDEISPESKKIVEAEFGALGNSLPNLKRVFATGFQNLGQPEMSVPLAINKVVQTLTLVFGGPSTPQLAGAMVRYFELPTYWAAGVVGTLGLAALYGAGFGPNANTWTVAMRSRLLSGMRDGTVHLQSGWRGLPGGAQMFFKELGGGIVAQVRVDQLRRSMGKHSREAGELLSGAGRLLADGATSTAGAGPAAEPEAVMHGALPSATDSGGTRYSDDEDRDDGGVPIEPEQAAFYLDAGEGAPYDSADYTDTPETAPPSDALADIRRGLEALATTASQQTVPSVGELVQELRTASPRPHSDGTDTAENDRWDWMQPSLEAPSGYAFAAAASTTERPRYAGERPGAEGRASPAPGAVAGESVAGPSAYGAAPHVEPPTISADEARFAYPDSRAASSVYEHDEEGADAGPSAPLAATGMMSPEEASALLVSMDDEEGRGTEGRASALPRPVAGGSDAGPSAYGAAPLAPTGPMSPEEAAALLAGMDDDERRGTPGRASPAPGPVAGGSDAGRSAYGAAPLDLSGLMSPEEAEALLTGMDDDEGGGTAGRASPAPGPVAGGSDAGPSAYGAAPLDLSGLMSPEEAAALLSGTPAGSVGEYDDEGGGPAGRVPSAPPSVAGGSDASVSSLHESDGDVGRGHAASDISALSRSTSRARREVRPVADPQGRHPQPPATPDQGRPPSIRSDESWEDYLERVLQLADAPQVGLQQPGTPPAKETRTAEKKRNWKDVAFGKWRRKDVNTAEGSQEQGREKGKTMRALLNRFRSKPAAAGGTEGAQSGKRKPNVLRKPPTSVDFLDQLRNRGRSSRDPAPAAPQSVMRGAVSPEPGERKQRDRFLSRLGIRR